jgi:GNAT superfamily N-acetyltransferase
MTVDIRLATADDRAEVLAVTVEAFIGDPILRWLLPDDDRYTAIAPAFFGVLLDLRLEYGEVWITDDRSASAWWERRPFALPADEQDVLWTDVIARFRDGERRRLARLDEVTSALHPPEPFWYLGVASVRPDRQGQGLGRRVIDAGCASADADGLLCMLETATPGNVPIYRRVGFEVAADATVAEPGPRLWMMTRTARSTS